MSKYDWSNVPKKIKWIATDSDMNVFGFTHFPKEVYTNCFSCGEHRSSFLLINAAPFIGEWQDSLEERPSE